MQATATTLNSEQENVPVNSRNKVVVASLIGTAIEFFDFYIYATAAVIVFPHIFFPQGDPTAATLQSLATFAIAFVARPIGSALFGHFGDRVGRKGFWPRCCWRWPVLVRVWVWAVSGAAQRCWPPKMPRHASVRCMAPSHSWAHRLASSLPTAPSCCSHGC